MHFPQLVVESDSLLDTEAINGQIELFGNSGNLIDSIKKLLKQAWEV